MMRSIASVSGVGAVMQPTTLVVINTGIANAQPLIESPIAFQTEAIAAYTAILPAQYISQTGSSNVFNGVDVGLISTPSFADLDGDGDLDAIVGEGDGTLRFFRNTGTAIRPVYTEQTGRSNPLNGFDVGIRSAPTFADLDGDGDLDAVVGEDDGVFNYYRNTGTASNPVYVQQTGSNHPLNGITVRDADNALTRSTIDLADLDGDGDLDAVVGGQARLRYFRNAGSAVNPIYTEQTGSSNPFSSLSSSTRGAPRWVDFDRDGDLDVVVGGQDGTLRYFHNSGTAISPIYTEQIGSTNPFNGIDVGAWSAPSFGDLDRDGDLDLVVGEYDGFLNDFRSEETPVDRVATERSSRNPFSNFAFAALSTPSVADLDGDGDLDGIVGTSEGTLRYFRNVGSTINPTYVEQTSSNPLNGFRGSGASAASLADLDGDGDLDGIVGTSSGTLHYLRNVGSVINPIYTEQTGTSNPFHNINGGAFSSSSFGDLDRDGDLDAIVGTSEGTLRYLLNIGTATNPSYSEQTASRNPFSEFDVGARSAPSFGDLDRDGDLDVVVGESDGTLRYLLNTGTATNPRYTEQTGASNPFNRIDVGNGSNLSFGDLDRDGNLDAIVGTSAGSIRYFSLIPNLAPTAIEDRYSLSEDGSVAIAASVLANDIDPNGTLLTAELISSVSNGVLTLSPDGFFTYSPNRNFSGIDRFTYAASDGVFSSRSTVTLTIAPVNDAPIATDDSIATSLEDSAVIISIATLLANDTTGAADEDTQSLSITAVDAAVGGTVAIDGDNIIFTPAANYSGTASFRYTVRDNGTTNGAPDFQSASAIASFSIIPVNDAPTLDAIANVTIAEDAGSQAIDLTSISPGDSNEAAQNLTIAAASDQLELFSNLSVSYTNGDPAGRLTFTPIANASGTVTIALTVQDDGGTANGGQDRLVRFFTVTIGEVNDAPVAADDRLAPVDEDAIVTIPITALLANDNSGAANEAEQTLSLTAVDSAIGGTVAIDGSNVVFTPTSNYSGTASFRYTIGDNGTTGGSSDPKQDSAIARFTIREVNDAPIAADDRLATTAENSAVAIPFAALLANDDPGAVDEANQTLTIAAVDSAIGGTVAIDGSTVVFVPTAHYSGSASFRYILQDNGTSGGSTDPKTATATARFNISEVNTAPVATDDRLADISEDAGPHRIAIATLLSNDLKGAANEDSQTLTIPAVDAAIGGTVAIEGSEIVFTPTANYSGAASFRYTVSDDGTTSGAADPQTDTAIVRFNILAVNDAPIARDDSYSTSEDLPLTIAAPGVLQNDTDLEAEALTVRLDTAPSHGTLSFNRDGSLRYQPNRDFNGSDRFTYLVTDASGSSDRATVSIFVTAVNDEPLIRSIADQTVDEDAPEVAIDFSVIDAETAANNLIVTAQSDNPALSGELTIAGVGSDRTLRFRPVANQNGSATITLTVSDGSATTAQRFNVIVNPIRDRPTLGSFSKTGREDANLFFNAADFITQFTDLEGDRLQTIQIVVLPDNGTLNLNGTPIHHNQIIAAESLDRLQFMPNIHFHGSDRFSVIASNGVTETAAATIALTLHPVNDAPRLIHPIANATIATGDAFHLDLRSFFTDVDGDRLTLQVIADDRSLPSWLRWNAFEGSLSGTAIATAAEAFNLQVTAIDPQGASAQTRFTLSIAAPVELPPAIVGELGTAPSPISFKGGRFRRQTATGGLLNGTFDRDWLIGSATADRLISGYGRYGFGSDRLNGNGGDDVLISGRHNDRLFGGSGDDWLLGGKGRDRLMGEAGRDRLFGGKGDDLLIGGAGVDQLRGGQGRDLFRFNRLSEAGDRILDFNPTQDLIDLRGIFAMPAFDGTSAIARFHQFVHFEQVGTHTEIRLDTDGQGSSTQLTTLVTLQNVSLDAIGSRNFVVV